MKGINKYLFLDVDGDLTVSHGIEKNGIKTMHILKETLIQNVLNL